MPSSENGDPFILRPKMGIGFCMVLSIQRILDLIRPVPQNTERVAKVPPELEHQVHGSLDVFASGDQLTKLMLRRTKVAGDLSLARGKRGSLKPGIWAMCWTC